MYPAGTNVSEVRKALWDKGFGTYKKWQKQSDRTALIVSSNIYKKESCHLSILPYQKGDRLRPSREGLIGQTSGGVRG